jgi:hypothetical protein
MSAKARIKIEWPRPLTQYQQPFAQNQALNSSNPSNGLVVGAATTAEGGIVGTGIGRAGTGIGRNGAALPAGCGRIGWGASGLSGLDAIPGFSAIPIGAALFATYLPRATCNSSPLTDRLNRHL